MRVRELEEQARFPHRRLADHGHCLTVSLAGTSQGVLQMLHLHVAPHEACQTTGSGCLETTARKSRTDQFVNIDGRAQSLDRDFSQISYFDVALGQSQGVGGDEHTAGIGELLHSGRQMRRLSYSRVLHIEIVADGAHHHLAGMQTDADVHREALLPANFLAEIAHGLLHHQSRKAGSNPMVFEGNRGAEQCHDAVSHDPGDRSLVAVHCFHHAVDHRIEQSVRLLRIQLGNQLSGTLDVGKQDGDLLALTCEALLGSENSFGQMPGGIGLGRAEAGRFVLRRGNRLAALEAESGVGGQLCPARAACKTHARPAFEAILCLGRIISLALETLQRSLPLCGGKDTRRSRYAPRVRCTGDHIITDLSLI